VKASFKVALAIAGACLAGRAQAQTVVVGPQAGSMALLPGAQVTVPIVADLTGSGGASLGSATLRLLWHPGVLAFRGVSGGALGQPAVNADSAGGSLRVAVANPAGAIGHPVLFSATFAVIGAPGASDTLQLQLQELTSAVTFANLLPGVATSAHVCVSTGLWGNVTNDSLVNSADALVILTNAVGLPITPYTTVNGDVDGDGQVSTRDALIVLTYAVELPVNGFRVGGMNPGACSMQAAASVQIQPRNAAVAVGDQFPLIATVRDTAGVTVQGVNLVWTSADTTIVKADGTGHLVGMTPGAALVYAFAAPGLKDSATVTVDAQRHVWWVNPALAATNGGVELGSQTHPFASIGQAVARAAANDSVMIAPATYGEVVHFARPLTLVGDSTAAGATVIRNPAGPGIAVDSLPGGGLVRLDRLHIEDSQGGIVAQGGAGAVLSFAGLRVVRSIGGGIAVTGAGRLLLDHTLVQGAVGQAVTATGVAFVGLHAVFTDAVTRAQNGSNTPAVGVRVIGADSLVADSLAVGTAGVWVDSARVMVVDGFQSFGTDGAGLAARIGGTFSLSNADVADASWPNSPQDSVPAVAILLVPASGTGQIVNTMIRHSGRSGLVVLGGDSVLVSGLVVQDIQNNQFGQMDAAMFQGMQRVAVQLSNFLDNNGASVLFEDSSAAMQVSVDSSAFRGTILRADHGALLDVRRSLFQNTQGPAIQTDSVRHVSLVRVEQSGMMAGYDGSGYNGPFGVGVRSADSLYLGGVYFHDNPFGAVICRSCRAVIADTSEFLRNGQYTGYLPNRGGTVVFESPMRAVVYGIQMDGANGTGLWLRGMGQGGRFSVDSSAFAGDSASLVYVDQPSWLGTEDTLSVTGSSFRGRNHGGYGVEISSVLAGITVRSSTFDSTTVGVSVYSSGATLIRGNTFTGVGMEALQASYQYPTSNVVFDNNKVTCADPAASDAIHLIRVSGAFTRNAIAGCLRGFSSWSDDSRMNLNIFADTVSRDSTYTSNLIDITGQYTSVFVAGNVVHGGRGTGLSLLGQISEARVDSNTVQGILGNGIVLGGSISAPVQMTYNLIADNDSNGITTSVPVNGWYNTVVRNGQLGAYFGSTSQDTFRLGNYVGNGHYGVYKASSPGFVVADSSYWGRNTGPRCYFVCDSSLTPATGDSVGVAPYAVFQPIDSSLVIGAPSDPGPPAAPVFRATRPRVALPARVGARPVALPASRPRPTSPVQPGRVRP
jgi:hypothetical protein